jgi:hypothetical protein
MNVTRALNDTRTRIRAHRCAYAYTYTRIGARVRARETFRVRMNGVVGAFNFAFLCAHTCVRGGACAYRCARGVGWVRRPPVVLGAGGRAGFYVYTAYTNRYASYRLHKQIFDLLLTLTAYANTLTIYLLRLTLTLTPHAVLPTKGVCVYLSRLPLASTLLGLSSICYLLPLGVSLLVFFCLLGLVLLYPSARLENRIISWCFAHLCRS